MFHFSPSLFRVILVLTLCVISLIACRGDSDESAFLSQTPLLRPTPTSSDRGSTTSDRAAARSSTQSGQPTSSSSGAESSHQTQGAPGGQALVFLDAGHGGVDTGAMGTTADGQTVYEKNFTLAIAQETAARLRADGISVVLSREDDSLPGSVASDYTSDGRALTPEGVLADLQRRIDRANASGALVLLSIHINAFSDPAVGGAETFYDSARPFAPENERFARLVQSNVVSSLQAQGVAVVDRGVTDDASLVGDAFGTLGASYTHLVLLGPPVPNRLRSSEMPGALSEPLFISNPAEATALTQPGVQQALASAYAKAIEQFLRSPP